MTPPSISMILLPRWERALGAPRCAAALLLAGCTGSLGAHDDSADEHHGFREVPYVLAGGAAGYLKTGQLVDVKITDNELLHTSDAVVGCTNSQGGPLDDLGDESLEGGLVDTIIA
ncbi:hypothetical protein WMF27_22880 [Sorangium sp. So ce281]|uniref:hypothetical protein n=1 Tax=unclassified Sorangium TaxID=2621164 RepID=UPI003F5F2468